MTDDQDPAVYVDCCGAPREVAIDSMVECPVCERLYRVTLEVMDQSSEDP